MFNADANNIYSLYTEATESKNQESQVIVHRDGTKQWWLHSKLHRENATAIEWANGDKYWYLHGKLHREDGAAIEYANGSKEWYLHGKCYAGANAWAKAVLKMHHKPHDNAAAEDYLRTILTKDDLI